MNNFNLYSATGQADLPLITANPNLHKKELYEPSPGLQAAVNVALALGQPLLLTGEPGTGKTELANHLAYFFKLGEPLVFSAQTSSVVRDLFYHYDALAHFQ
ncbi:MAG: AAA family ATPase, partial [Saprospiraceae bacterium]